MTESTSSFVTKFTLSTHSFYFLVKFRRKAKTTERNGRDCELTKHPTVSQKGRAMSLLVSYFMLLLGQLRSYSARGRIFGRRGIIDIPSNVRITGK
jgi:hypothetical protein